MDEFPSSALILLAAGSSRRMGQMKQLLPINDRPMLRRAAEAAVASGIGAVIVVLGANAGEVRPCLTGLAVHIVVNEGWEEGMGSSVRVGMKALDSLPIHPGSVIVALADQPNISASHVTRLIDAHRKTNKSIVASRHEGKLMPPVFFSETHFPSLQAMQGDVGARELLKANAHEVFAVESGDLGDLDTIADYENFLKKGPEAGSASE